MKKEYQLWIDLISQCIVDQMQGIILSKALFGFHFPSSFLHREAFEKGDRKEASASAIFYPDNLAKISKKGEIKEVTWLMAYNSIVRASFGATYIPTPPDIATIMPKKEDVQQRIDAWVQKFNALPSVSARIFNPDDGRDEIISIHAPADTQEAVMLMNNNIKHGEVQIFLSTKGTAQWLNERPHGGDQIEQKYSGLHYKSWQEMYETLSNYLKERFDGIPTFETTGFSVDSSLPKTEDFKKKFDDFKSHITTTFAEITSVQLNEDTDSESGKIFSIDFPVSVNGLAGNLPSGTSGWLNFYADNTARFSGDSQYEGKGCMDSDLFKKHIGVVFDKDIPWIAGIQRLESFLKDLSEVVPTKA